MTATSGAGRLVLDGLLGGLVHLLGRDERHHLERHRARGIDRQGECQRRGFVGPAFFEDDATGVAILYFDSNRIADCLPNCGPFAGDSANNGNDIYASVRLYDDTFDEASLVAELSTGSVDRQPAIRRDGLEMFLSSNRPGSLDCGGIGCSLDICVSTRASTSDPWSEPVNLGPVVNTGPATIDNVTFNGNDAGPELSFDGTALYFQSLRPGTSGIFDLYVVRRAKLRGPDKAR